MLQYYQLVRDSPVGATLCNKMSKLAHYMYIEMFGIYNKHVYVTLMCAKNHIIIFYSFLDIRKNAQWPRFCGPPFIHAILSTYVVGQNISKFVIIF